MCAIHSFVAIITGNFLFLKGILRKSTMRFTLYEWNRSDVCIVKLFTSQHNLYFFGLQFVISNSIFKWYLWILLNFKAFYYLVEFSLGITFEALK